MNGLGRVCDGADADAEMNILGGMAGLALAASLTARRQPIAWPAGVKAALIASALLLVSAVGVGPLPTFRHMDRTGPSAANSQQRRAVAEAVRESFGDHYELGEVAGQPCVGAACRNIIFTIFTLLSRDRAHPEAFGNGSLSWPDRDHLNVLLENSDRPGPHGISRAGGEASSQWAGGLSGGPLVHGPALPVDAADGTVYDGLGTRVGTG
ncbi:hypothetical protein [Actinacidiphila sp. ITFR-21]|uniref:hypothetical protein n=1 Tax=Actinacidiphila sp. ITFR-21 TaxID=3075199 RepID=UPI0028895963|nr:hypothetical protein [Streptomyces sp. ITFR-21]WNI17223.1 hypothetical protein RLT57_18020 [Streptomyces sp. ITFR-21]